MAAPLPTQVMGSEEGVERKGITIQGTRVSVQSSELGPPPSTVSECGSPPGPKGGRSNTSKRVRGLNSDDWTLDKHSGIQYSNPFTVQKVNWLEVQRRFYISLAASSPLPPVLPRFQRTSQIPSTYWLLLLCGPKMLTIDYPAVCLSIAVINIQQRFRIARLTPGQLALRQCTIVKMEVRYLSKNATNCLL